MSKDLFEIASREKYGFPTSKGSLTTYELWDQSIESLDAIAIKLDARVKELDEGRVTFTSKSVGGTKELRETRQKLEIVIYIISVKENEDAKKAASKTKREQLAYLKELADKKAKSHLEESSLEDLQAMIAKLEKE